MVLLVAACGGDAAVDTGATTTIAATGAVGTLDGRTFLSTSWEGEIKPVADTTMRLTFADGAVGLSAGCNTMRAGYTIEGDVLVLDGTMAGTMMGCEQALMDQDAVLSEWLASGPTVALDGDQLTMSDGSTTVVLVDEEVADPDRPVVGTTWVLESIVTGSTASSVPAGVQPPTLSIDEDGTAELFAGCNTGRGAVEVGDGTVTGLPPAMTEMGCEPEAMAIEADVLATMDGELRWDVDGATLTLSSGDRSLVLRAG